MTAAAERAAGLSDAARGGDRRALARLLTEVENRSAVGEAAVRRLYPLTSAATRVLLPEPGAPVTPTR